MTASLPPPAGYDSWLDYAVDTFDTRSLQLDHLLSTGDTLDRQAMRASARAELTALRARIRPVPDQRDALHSPEECRTKLEVLSAHLAEGAAQAARGEVVENYSLNKLISDEDDIPYG